MSLSRLSYFLVLTAALQITSVQSAIVTGAYEGNIPGLEPGEVLLGELNCVACHVASPAVADRLASKRAPLLGKNGAAIRPQFIRAFLANPSLEKPGTAMPDVMGALAPAERTEVIEALTHFIVSESPSQQNAGVAADIYKIDQGRVLFHEVGCVACHAPQQGPKAGSNPEIVPPGLKEASPAFPVHLASKYAVMDLAAFLKDPVSHRPSGRMPSLNLGEEEAISISMYLLREQAGGVADPTQPIQKIQGVSYQYFEGEFSEDAPDFDKLKPVSTGSIDHFSILPRKRNDHVGMRFRGNISIAGEGNYNFYCASDDGSRLYIDDKLVVTNDGFHPFQEKRGSVRLTPGDHRITVTWFNGTADYGLKVSYSGAGLSKREIPGTALWHHGQAMNPLGETPFALDATKADRGKAYFRSLGCAACHLNERPGNVSTLESLAARTNEGCLASAPTLRAPLFDLSDGQRAILRQTIQKIDNLRKPLLSKEAVNRKLASLNCFACHSRESIGGPDAARADYFKTIGDAEMGDEGRMPPHLTGIGSKLKPEWLGQVLTNKGAVRPYMASRMPQFGAANAGPLVMQFAEADAAAVEAAENFDSTAAKYGRRLAGTGGLACISCHTFGKFKSLGIPAIDLTKMHHRLRRSWFEKYVVNPAALRPGTRMPSFWPEGKAVNHDVLEGNTEKQINALWMYLSQGADAEVPPGLVQGKMELVADKEPVIYRNFIRGAGSRAIGVGYPEKANLAFDANDLRLALIWQGPFIDAARHRTGRGEGYEPPLGDHVRGMPSGPAFAILSDLSALWPQASGKQAGFGMNGYELDAARRPIFLYHFRDYAIRDFPQPIAGELDPRLRRTIEIKGPPGKEPLWFRAAVGSKIERQGDWFEVDGMKLRLKSSTGAEPVVRESQGSRELLIPLNVEQGQTTLEEEIVW